MNVIENFLDNMRTMLISMVSLCPLRTRWLQCYSKHICICISLTIYRFCLFLFLFSLFAMHFSSSSSLLCCRCASFFLCRQFDNFIQRFSAIRLSVCLSLMLLKLFHFHFIFDANAARGVKWTYLFICLSYLFCSFCARSVYFQLRLHLNFIDVRVERQYRAYVRVFELRKTVRRNKKQQQRIKWQSRNFGCKEIFWKSIDYK